MTMQINLTERLVEGFIAADKAMKRIEAKYRRTAEGESDPKIQTKIQAELDAAAGKHGFKDYAQYETVGENITLIIGGLDPDTGKFTAPNRRNQKRDRKRESGQIDQGGRPQNNAQRPQRRAVGNAADRVSEQCADRQKV
jgi:hypothetical protein